MNRSRTRVKICGLTRVEDALYAADLGVDAIGLVFYAPSPRALDLVRAKEIVDSLPAFINKVGLFVSPSKEEVEAVLSEVALDTLQFHGDEDADFCEQFRVPYFKAIRVKSKEESRAEKIRTQLNSYAKAQAILLDTYVEGVAGGTGEKFDWNLIPENCSKPIILAGGLNADNVAEAINTTNPYAVDVSGGVEESKGIKSHVMMRDFVNNVNRLITS